jgi:hypothetical protein
MSTLIGCGDIAIVWRRAGMGKSRARRRVGVRAEEMPCCIAHAGINVLTWRSFAMAPPP